MGEGRRVGSCRAVGVVSRETEVLAGFWVEGLRVRFHVKPWLGRPVERVGRELLVDCRAGVRG